MDAVVLLAERDPDDADGRVRTGREHGVGIGVRHFVIERRVVVEVGHPRDLHHVQRLVRRRVVARAERGRSMEGELAVRVPGVERIAGDRDDHAREILRVLRVRIADVRDDERLPRLQVAELHIGIQQIEEVLIGVKLLGDLLLR